MESTLSNMLRPGDVNAQMQLTLALQALQAVDGDVTMLSSDVRERFGFPPQGKIEESRINIVLGMLGQDTKKLMGEIKQTGGLWSYITALPESTQTK